MLALYVWLKNWFGSEKGQDLIEYALLVALLIVIAVATLTSIGGQINSIFSAVLTKLQGS